MSAKVTYKFFFQTSSGNFTIEQRFEMLNPKKTTIEFLQENGVKFNIRGNWVFYIWDGCMSEGINTRLTWDKSLERLKEIVKSNNREKHTGAPLHRLFIRMTGSSVSRICENYLDIRLD